MVHIMHLDSRSGKVEELGKASEIIRAINSSFITAERNYDGRGGMELDVYTNS